MNNYKLLHETSDHFILHNGKASFHVAKKGISEPTADKIRSFANGGRTTAGNITQKENEKNMGKIDANIQAAKHYSDGGQPQSPEEVGIEAEEKAKRAQAQEPTPTPDPNDYVRYNNPDKFAAGGKLTAQDRKHIAPKNFAGPDKSYPIEDASHARNALARVSQHGSPELKAQVRAKVHSKYPGIEQSNADGGSVPYRQPQKYDDGGEVAPGLWNSIKKSFGTNDSEVTKPEIPATDHSAEYDKIRQTNTENMTTGNYAMGGNITDPSQAHSTSKESQSEAIRRYADGNPATLSKGGHIHNNAGKNQLHFHFYDGAVVPTQLDKEEGAGPQQPSALDKYVGGEPAQGTPLDNYAEGGDVPTDSDKLGQAAQDLQAGLNSQTAPPPTSMSDNPTPATSTEGSHTEAATVPQSQQIPAVQKPLSPTPDQSPTMLSDFDKSLALEKSGIEQGAAAQTKGYQDTAQAIGQNVMQQKQQMDAYKLEADKITQQNTDLFNAVASSKIDPNHFWNSKSTGGKIMATIGVILGGAASGMAGGSGQNQGLAALQNHIQQDIEAQKNDQSNKMNLYKMGLERYRDAQSAQQFATLQSNALLQGTLQKIAAQTGAPQAQATAQQMIGQLGVQNAGIRSDLAMKQAAFGAMNQAQPAQAGVDPNKMRLLINAGVIPKEEVPTAMKEYGEYQKLGNSLDEVDNVFNQARQDSNYTQRISEGIPGGSMLPTFRDSTKKFQAETNALLDKYTKDLTGRVTPQSMENLRHSIPLAGDSPDVFNRKLASFKDIVREAYTFPTLSSYRLLNMNNPVVQSSATRNKKFTEGPPK